MAGEMAEAEDLGSELDVPVGRGALARREGGMLPSDLVLAPYLLFVLSVLVLGRRPLAYRSLLIAAYALTSMGVLALGMLPHPRRALLTVLRICYPLLLLPFLYGSLQYINRALSSGYYDSIVIAAEARVFGMQLSQELYKLIPSRAISEVLHGCYLLYIVLTPTVAVAMALRRRWNALEVFTTTVLATYVFCYVIFVLFPVRGPFYEFGPIDPGAKHSFLAVLAHKLLEGAASSGTAFPSSHVAASVAIWMHSKEAGRGIYWAIFLVAAGIFIGTVYGGFHYGVDALAGLLVGVALGLAGGRVHHALAALCLRRRPG